MSGGFKTSQTMRNKSFGPRKFSTDLGNKTEDGENKSMQVEQDYTENDKLASELQTESSPTNTVRTEEASEGGNGSLKSVETTTETTEVSLTKNGGGRKKAKGEYLYLLTFFLHL